MAAQIAGALARGIADVAEHKQIADRGAGQAGDVGRFAGPQAVGEPPGGLRDRSGFRLRLFHPVGEMRVDGDTALGRQLKKALRQIDVACRERGIDLALGNGG